MLRAALVHTTADGTKVYVDLNMKELKEIFLASGCDMPSVSEAFGRIMEELDRKARVKR